MDHDIEYEYDHHYATRKRRRATEQLELIVHYAVSLAQLQIAAAAAPATSAPADRYFGKLKMSSLRIRYEVMQLRARYETHQLLPDQAQHLLLLTEDSFQDWARDYPRDPWLPSTAYAMATFYDELSGTVARDHAVALFVYVKSHFPATNYAQQSRDRLHRGVFTKPEPAWASVATPSPAVSAGASPTASPSPGSSASSPGASASPRARAAPNATASPTGGA